MSEHDVTIEATSNEWDAPVSIYRTEGATTIRRDAVEPEHWESKTYFPHAVIYIDGVLTTFDRERQP